MSDLARHNPVDALLARQQDLLLEMAKTSLVVQQQLVERQEVQEQRLDNHASALKRIDSSVRALYTTTQCITVVQLEGLLDESWNTEERQDIGAQLAAFSRRRGVKPSKIPHPLYKYGVNAYRPDIIRDWLVSKDHPVPPELQ